MPTQPNNLIAIIHEYWPILGGASLPALLVGALRLHRYRKHARWAQDVVELYRRLGTPVQVFLHDREHLDWAVREGLLKVVDTFKGGWLVAEQMQLGSGAAGTR
ncbi:MAG TPA: hypothetical protein VF815_20990 [Myxococcaceae bacterium]|jgi:hypothetical protein